MDTPRHVTDRHPVAQEDIERLPFVLDTLRPERDRRAWRPHDYMSLHRHLGWLYGAAREHRCFDCCRGAHHWSLSSMDSAIFDERIGYWYSLDPTDYLPRCSGCHQRHDKAIRIECPIKVAG